MGFGSGIRYTYTIMSLMSHKNSGWRERQGSGATIVYIHTHYKVQKGKEIKPSIVAIRRT
jgi:hypothetical protein